MSLPILSWMLFETGSAVMTIAEWLGPQGLIGTTLGAGFFGVVIKALIDKYLKPKIDREAAEDDAHEKASRMSLALAASLREEVARMGDRVTALEGRLETERTAREALQEQVAQQNSALYGMRAWISRALDYFDDLAERWEVYRERDEPPVPPQYTGDLG